MERKMKTFLFLLFSVYCLLLLAFQFQHVSNTVPVRCKFLDEFQNLFIPATLAKEDVWIEVKASQLYVFSAYIDSRELFPVVKIMAASEDSVISYCQLWIKEHQEWYYHISKAEHRVLPGALSSRL